MKAFATLLWLEHRRSWVWAVSLIGSLAFWAWGIKQVQIADAAERLSLRCGLLGIAALLGPVVLCLMVGRIRSETRHGRYQVLLMTPPSGYTHVLVRFTYATVVALVYYVAIGMLYWWIAELAGIHFDARTLLELVLGAPAYALGVTVVPLLAWTVLLMVFVSAYRISGQGWVPGTVMILATPFLVRHLGDAILAAAYALPGWRIFANAPQALEPITRQLDVMTSGPRVYYGVPIEPLLILLALTALMLVAAGRIWQEVEA